MKKLAFISSFTFAVITVISCGGDIQREPGRTYMPDMAESQAYETYKDHSNLAKKELVIIMSLLQALLAAEKSFHTIY